MTESFRCAAASALRNEPITGTASTVRRFLLVENPGPWGIDAVRDSRLPPTVKQGLARQAAEAGVRVLLIRRHHRRAPKEDFSVFAASADPVDPWLEGAVLAHPEDLLALDLGALGAGRSLGLPRVEDSLLCVCTHGRHDACCAERGRPIAAALTAAHPGQTWEVSHIGGDRFAGNLLVLPHGLYYGKLDVPAALTVAGDHLAGWLDLDHLRGRSGLTMAVQAAEIGLRRQLGERQIDAVRFAAARTGLGGHVAEFLVGAARYEVTVSSETPPAVQQLTCRAVRQNPIAVHRLVSVRLLD